VLSDKKFKNETTTLKTKNCVIQKGTAKFHQPHHYWQPVKIVKRAYQECMASRLQGKEVDCGESLIELFREHSVRKM